MINNPAEKFNLLKKIENYIDYRRNSNGGYAKIHDSDIVELNDIIYKIIELKCQADANGDYPIECILVDRRKERQLHPVKISYNSYIMKNNPLMHGGKIELLVNKIQVLTNELKTEIKLNNINS